IEAQPRGIAKQADPQAAESFNQQRALTTEDTEEHRGSTWKSSSGVRIASQPWTLNTRQSTASRHRPRTPLCASVSSVVKSSVEISRENVTSEPLTTPRAGLKYPKFRRNSDRP